MVKISQAVSLAIHGMVYLATRPDSAYKVGEIAYKLRASKAHLQKVFQRLANAGLLKSNRGPRGGYTLGRKSHEINLLDIYEAIEGPMKNVNCLFDEPVCTGKQCIFGDLLGTSHKRHMTYLEGMKLSDLTGVYERGDTCEPRHHQDR
jgi:Rrf2 family protein